MWVCVGSLLFTMHCISTLSLLPSSSPSSISHPLLCPISSSSSSSPSNTIKVVVNGASTPIGKAAIAAVTKARGMELAGAVDSVSVGKDAGELANLEEPLEVPVSNDLVMVLASLSQKTSTGVMIDFTEPALVLDNVRQAVAFGLRTVVAVPGVEMEKVAALSAFCEKSSMGCIIAPSLSVGAVLLQQAATAAAFHYRHVEIVESKQEFCEYPSLDALRLADSLSGMGQLYNRGDCSIDSMARGAIVGDGVHIHSLALPGILSSTTVHFSAPGEVLSFRHDVTDVQALIPGLLMAIRRVIRLKSLVYGLEKIF